jgi:hypothetical protein
VAPHATPHHTSPQVALHAAAAARRRGGGGGRG